MIITSKIQRSKTKREEGFFRRRSFFAHPELGAGPLPALAQRPLRRATCFRDSHLRQQLRVQNRHCANRGHVLDSIIEISHSVRQLRLLCIRLLLDMRHSLHCITTLPGSVARRPLRSSAVWLALIECSVCIILCQLSLSENF